MSHINIYNSHSDCVLYNMLHCSGIFMFNHLVLAHGYFNNLDLYKYVEWFLFVCLFVFVLFCVFVFVFYVLCCVVFFVFVLFCFVFWFLLYKVNHIKQHYWHNPLLIANRLQTSSCSSFDLVCFIYFCTLKKLVLKYHDQELGLTLHTLSYLCHQLWLLTTYHSSNCNQLAPVESQNKQAFIKPAPFIT